MVSEASGKVYALEGQAIHLMEVRAQQTAVIVFVSAPSIYLASSLLHFWAEQQQSEERMRTEADQRLCYPVSQALSREAKAKPEVSAMRRATGRPLWSSQE